MAIRKCTRCKQKKNIKYFYYNNYNGDGFDTWCKLCRSQYGKQYQKENEEELKVKRKIYNKKYLKENKEILNIRNQIRRNKSKKLPATLTSKQWNQCKEYFDNKCAYCGEERKLTQDHFIALAKGGGYTKENIIPACQICNSSKGISFFEDWYPKYKHYSAEREKNIYNFLKIKYK